MISAMAYWTKKKLNAVADKGANNETVDLVTGVINQNTDSYADRQDHFAITREVFNVANPD